MADSSVSITEGSGKNIDTRTNASGDHRQVVVLGNESATDSVASVQATDPTSAALGLVVREPNSTAIVSGLRDVRVQSLVDGTVSVENITRVRNVVDGTLSTVTRVSNVVDGTLSVVTFVPTVQRVQNVVDGTLTTVTGVDRVRNLVDGTISTVDTVTRVNRVMNLIDGTLSTVTGITNTVRIQAGDGTFAVYFSPATPAVSIAGVNTANTLGVYLSATAGTLVVKLARDSAAVATDDAAFTIGTGTGTPIMGLADSTSQDSVDEDDVGVLRMTTNRLLMTNIQATAGIFTVSGTTSTAGNNTLVSPSASYNFKVFAYSIQTTGIVSSAPRFTTGASAGATELWRPLINSVQTTSAPIGANLSVSPPGYLFATGVSTTLSLYLDTGTLVHYSVSFIKESA